MNAGDMRLPQGHNLCNCGRWKHMHAITCWKCEKKDDIFVLLDSLIEQKIDTPRGVLEQKVQVAK